MLIKYISIEKDEKLKEVISKIQRETGTIHYKSFESPINLTGNQQVLTLRKSYNSSEFIRVDGPGFIISELFDYFY